MTKKEKDKLVMDYIYMDTVANLAMGVDVKGEFYKAALCGDLNANLDLKLEDKSIEYINGYVDFLLEQPGFFEQAKGLGVARALQIIGALPCSDTAA